MNDALLCTMDSQATPTQRRWTLVGRLNDEGSPRCLPLEPLPFRIGRQAGLSLTLCRQTVSGVHAEIFDMSGTLYIRDLGSTNGTFVNGKRIEAQHRLGSSDLIQFADVPFRLTLATVDSRSHTRRENLGDQALALVQFERLFLPNGIVPHVQPIVELDSRKLTAYEVLARSRLIGLEMPKAMFETAAELGMATELSEAVRLQAIAESSLLPMCPHLFFNTHPDEVSSSRFVEHCGLLRKRAPSLRLTIEVHETAITNIDDMTRLRKELDDLNISLAFDDFGVGQARLAELTAVNPRYLKFDRCLIKNIHEADPSRKTMVASLVAMAKDIGVVPLAECIETEDEAAACLELGFVLGQGFCFGHPKAIADHSC